MTRVDIEKINDLVERGLVRSSRHSRLPLTIYKYTAKCAYERKWDDLSIICRGLVLDDGGNVVARGFRKFFNDSEHDGIILQKIDWSKKYEVTEKMDGSLFMVFKYGGFLRFSTVGSFKSVQAEIGKNLFLEKYLPIFRFPEGKSLLFELIHPQNRIVVKYNFEELILLDVLDNETGKSMGRKYCEAVAKNVGFPIVKKFELSKDEYLDSAIDDGQNEGVVVKFEDDLRVKIKLPEYVRFHSILTQTSSRKIWEGMKNGDDILKLIEGMPDEFFRWANKVYRDIEFDYNDIESQAKETLEAIMDMSSMKKIKDQKERKKYFASMARAMGGEYSSILFSMYDGKDYSEIIWKMVEPPYSLPFSKDEE